MSKTNKIPRILKINQIKDWKLDVVFNNGEHRSIDFEMFFKEHHFADDPFRSQLLNLTTFQTVTVNEGTLNWPSIRQKIQLSDGAVFEVPFDLDPIVLYDFSVLDPNYKNIHIGAILRKARNEAGLTQEEVARRSGTTKHYISRIENQHTDIEFGTLQKIVELGLGKHLEIYLK